MSASESPPYAAARLKRGAMLVAGGKVVTALLAFISFVIVARILQLDEYGLYASVLAVVELGVAVAMGGLDWVAARMIPEYRLKASGGRLLRLIAGLLAIQVAFLAALATLMFSAAHLISGYSGSPEAAHFMQIYALVLLLEGSGRLVRDEILSVLMCQAQALVAQLARSAVFIIALWHGVGDGSLLTVAYAELAASTVALLIGAALMGKELWRYRFLPARDPQWKPAPLRVMWRIARNSYASYLMLLAAGPQVLTLLIARLGGAELAGIYGFSRNLVEQVRKALPADLLMAVVRPAIVARFVDNQDFSELNRHVRLLWMANLFFLAPILSFFFVFGDAFVQVVGHGKYAGAATIILLLLIGLVPGTHRRMLEVAAHSLMRSDLCVRASIVMAVVPFAATVVLALGGGVGSVVSIVIVAEMVFSVLVVYGLRQAAYLYEMGWRNVGRLVATFLLAVLLVWLTPLPSGGWVELTAGSLFTLLAIAMLACVTRPFEAAHRDVINRLLGRQVFPF